MEKLLKENILYIVIVIIVIIGGAYGVYVLGKQAVDGMNGISEKQEVLKTKKEQYELEKRKAAKPKAEEKKKKEAQSGKIIYEVLGQQFSPEASFGIMFDNILANMTNSGLRIRSIEYDYSPASDKIIEAGGGAGYNACELFFVTVSNYTQLQNFFKNIAKENYLTCISEVYIEPYDKDKSILITRFKIRLYTKTI